MGWKELDFSLGLGALHAWNEAERERRRGIWLEVNRLSDLPSGERPSSKVSAAMAAEAEEAAPLWMQIVGFNPWTARSVGPVERRAGIGRLLNVVEVLFRAEMGGGDGGRQKAEGGKQRTEGGRLNAEGGDGSGAGVEEDLGASLSADGGPLTPRANGCAPALSPRGEGKSGGASRIF